MQSSLFIYFFQIQNHVERFDSQTRQTKNQLADKVPVNFDAAPIWRKGAIDQRFYDRHFGRTDVCDRKN